jgi:hypothetical protein
MPGCASWAAAASAADSGPDVTIPVSLYSTGTGNASSTAVSLQTGTAPSLTRTNPCTCVMLVYNGTLRVRKVPGATQVYWSQIGTYKYDVVKGSLTSLRNTQGDFTAALNVVTPPACLAQDTSALQVDDTSTSPAPGDGVFYLLRPVNPSCLLGGSYDSGTLSQIEGRDIEIAAATGACP